MPVTPPRSAMAPGDRARPPRPPRRSVRRTLSWLYRHSGTLTLACFAIAAAGEIGVTQTGGIQTYSGPHTAFYLSNVALWAGAVLGVIFAILWSHRATKRANGQSPNGDPPASSDTAGQEPAT